MEFTLHRNFETLAPLAADWNVLLSESVTHVPFLRYEYLSAWWAKRGGGEWPNADLAVVTAHQMDAWPASRPCSPAGIARISRRCCCSQHRDLGLPGPDRSPGRFARFPGRAAGFRRPTWTLDWRLLDWHNLLETSPTLPALQAEAGKRGWTFSMEKTYHAPSIR